MGGGEGHAQYTIYYFIQYTKAQYYRRLATAAGGKPDPEIS